MKITYDETRLWVQWVRVFTPSDLAQIMGVPVEVITGHLVGMQRHGTIEDTGDRINGTGPEEPIYSFVPLPIGPTHHPHKTPPEKLAGYLDILSPRGLPVRIRTERKMRRAMSTPGSRGRLRRAEQRYYRMLDAKQERAQKQREREGRMRKGDFSKAGKRSRKHVGKDWEDFS